MITKKFEQFVNELKYNTYFSAAKKLGDKGHKERAEKLKKHNWQHRAKMSMVENYNDLRPFEIWAYKDKGEYIPDNDSVNHRERTKLTVYLADWGYMPADENECSGVDISPTFFYNSKEPYMDPTKFNLFKGEKEHKKGIDDILQGDYSLNLSYWGEVSFMSYEGGDKNYFKFTNRRDAVRFLKLIKSDPHFVEDLVDATKGCEELNPFLIQKKFAQSLKVNDLYVG